MGALPPWCARPKNPPVRTPLVRALPPSRRARPKKPTRRGTPCGCPPLPPVWAPFVDYFGVRIQNAIALQNAQGNCIHQRQNLLRLPASRRGTPCGCPPPRVRAPRRLFWRPNSNAIALQNAPGQLHPPATKPPEAARIPYGHPLCAPSPLGARALEIHPYGHPLCAPSPPACAPQKIHP